MLKNITTHIMKKISSILLFLLILSSVSYAGEKKLSGIYQGKNIYVMNPFGASGVGFCIFEVQVNNKVTTDEINSSAFEIDLSLYQFKIGDAIDVLIKYKTNCEPKVLNPEVLKPTSTFNCTAIKLGKDNILRWTTTGEAGSLEFVIEQFRWNKWIRVGTVMGIGTPTANNYEFEVHPHSGNNEFRIKQIDFSKQPKYSKTVKYRSIDQPVTFAPQKKVANEITFSAETMYEIYDPYGNLLLKGFGNKVNVSSLKPIDKYSYTLHYDNQVAEFQK